MAVEGAAVALGVVGVIGVVALGVVVVEVEGVDMLDEVGDVAESSTEARLFPQAVKDAAAKRDRPAAHAKDLMVFMGVLLGFYECEKKGV